MSEQARARARIFRVYFALHLLHILYFILRVSFIFFVGGYSELARLLFLPIDFLRKFGRRLLGERRALYLLRFPDNSRAQESAKRYRDSRRDNPSPRCVIGNIIRSRRGRASDAIAHERLRFPSRPRIIAGLIGRIGARETGHTRICIECDTPRGHTAVLSLRTRRCDDGRDDAARRYTGGQRGLRNQKGQFEGDGRSSAARNFQSGD